MYLTNFFDFDVEKRVNQPEKIPFTVSKQSAFIEILHDVLRILLSD